MAPCFGRPPVDDPAEALLCPGARTLLDVTGIDRDGRRDVDPEAGVERVVALVVDAGRRRTRAGQPVEGDVVEDPVDGDPLERAVLGVRPFRELVEDPGEQPDR